MSARGIYVEVPWQKKFSKKNVEFPVTSFGLETTSGFGAHPPIIKIASSMGVDLSSHRTVCEEKFLPKKNDLYICTEPDHIDRISLLLGEEVKIALLGFWGKPKLVYIHDPYSANHIYMKKVVKYIIGATESLAKQISQNIVKGKLENHSPCLK